MKQGPRIPRPLCTRNLGWAWQNSPPFSVPGATAPEGSPFPRPARGLLVSCAAVADKHGGEMSRWGWGRILLLDLPPIRAPSPLDPGPLPLGHGDFSHCFCVPWSLGDFWSSGRAHLLAIAGPFSQGHVRVHLSGCHHLTRTSGWLR